MFASVVLAFTVLVVVHAAVQRSLRNYYTCMSIDAALVDSQSQTQHDGADKSVFAWSLFTREAVDGYIIHVGTGSSKETTYYTGSWKMYGSDVLSSSLPPAPGWVLVSQATGTLTAGNTYEFKLPGVASDYQFFILVFSPAVQNTFFFAFDAALCSPSSPFPIPAPTQLFSRTAAPQ